MDCLTISSSDPIHEVHQCRLELLTEVLGSIARIKKHKIILEKQLYTVVNDQTHPKQSKEHLGTCIYLQNKLLFIINRMQTTIIDSIVECQQEMNSHSSKLLKEDKSSFEYRAVYGWKHDGNM